MSYFDSDDVKLRARRRIFDRIQRDELSSSFRLDDTEERMRSVCWCAFFHEISQWQDRWTISQTLDRRNLNINTSSCSTSTHCLSFFLYRHYIWRIVTCQYQNKSCISSSLTWRVLKANRKWFHHSSKEKEDAESWTCMLFWWSRSEGLSAWDR